MQIDNLDIDTELQQIPDDFQVFKELIKLMIVVEPEQRCTLDDVLDQIRQIDEQTLSDVNLTYKKRNLSQTMQKDFKQTFKQLK